MKPWRGRGSGSGNYIGLRLGRAGGAIFDWPLQVKSFSITMENKKSN